jgi:hypothetical protein
VVAAAAAAAAEDDLYTGGPWFQSWLCHQLSWHVINVFPQPLKLNVGIVASNKQVLPPSRSTPTYYS